MTTCTNIGLQVALNIWASGEKLDAYCLYGVSSIVIGRTAKVLAFLAAIPIIIDIIGEERIVRSQISLTSALTTRRAAFADFIISFSAQVAGVFKGSLPDFFQHRISSLLKRPSLYLVLLCLSGTLTILIYHLWFPTTAMIWEVLLYIPLSLIIFFSSILSIIVVFVIIFFLALGLMFLLAFVPVGFVFLLGAALAGSETIFRNPRLCVFIRIVSSFVLTSGFLLDLLVS